MKKHNIEQSEIEFKSFKEADQFIKKARKYFKKMKFELQSLNGKYYVKHEVVS